MVGGVSWSSGVAGVQEFRSCRISKIAGVQTIPQPTTIEPNEVDAGYCLNSCNSIFFITSELLSENYFLIPRALRAWW